MTVHVSFFTYKKIHHKTVHAQMEGTNLPTVIFLIANSLGIAIRKLKTRRWTHASSFKLDAKVEACKIC